MKADFNIWSYLLGAVLGVAIGVLVSAQICEAETGWVAAYIHDSNPTHGIPWDRSPEIVTDQAGVGRYWTWKNNEVLLFLTVRRDHQLSGYNVTSPGILFMYMHKWPTQ